VGCCDTVAATDGLGLTVSVNVNVLVHVFGAVPDVAVTLNVAVTAELVVLVNVPDILLALVPADSPLRPEAVGADHVYTVPDGTVPSVPSAGANEKGASLHTVIVLLLIAGFGLTVTDNVNVLVHAFGAVPDIAVTLYVDVTEAFVVLVNV
jgi:hypothetical protein